MTQTCEVNDKLKQVLLSRIEAAYVLGVSGPTVDKLRNSGELPFVKLGRRRFYEIGDLHALIARNKEGGNVA